MNKLLVKNVVQKHWITLNYFQLCYFYTYTFFTVRKTECNNVYIECVPVPIVTCSNLPLLENGMIMYSAGAINNRPFLTSAVHSCNTGYTLTGATMRVCESDGVWSGLAPTCLRKWNELCTVCLLSVSSPIYSWLPWLTPTDQRDDYVQWWIPWQQTFPH